MATGRVIMLELEATEFSDEYLVTATVKADALDAQAFTIQTPFNNDGSSDLLEELQTGSGLELDT